MVITMFLIFFGTLLVGIPIGVAVAFATIIGLMLDPGITLGLEYVARNMITSLDSLSLIAVPMFILSGNIMAKGGISRKLYDFFAYFIGDKCAGLPIAAIVTCLFYGAISGSSPATVAAVGAMTIPMLVQLGYDKNFVVGMVATAGGLGVIIPPSLPFIMYGVSSNESIADLFMAGVLPGVLIAFIMSLYTYFYCKIKGEDKAKLQDNVRRLRTRGFWNILKDSFWALMTPVIILGGIYGGVVTPTEAATISVIYSLIISVFVYKTLKFKGLVELTRMTIRSSGPVLIIVAAATTFGRVLTLMQIPQSIASALITTFNSKVAILLIINIFLLFVGMVMETLAAILILTPIFLPVIQAIGVNPVHFGVIMVVNLAIGFVTPPVGVNLFIASNLSRVPVLQIAKHALPYILAFLIALILITYLPQISLLLVS